MISVDWDDDERDASKKTTPQLFFEMVLTIIFTIVFSRLFHFITKTFDSLVCFRLLCICCLNAHLATLCLFAKRARLWLARRPKYRNLFKISVNLGD
jgi:hypothetical protein